MERAFIQMELYGAGNIVPGGRLLNARNGVSSGLKLRRFYRRRHSRPHPFSLLVLFGTSTVVVAFLGLFLHSITGSVPQIIDRVAHVKWDSWMPSLHGGSSRQFLLTNPEAAGQVNYVSTIIGSKYSRSEARELALSIVAESRKASVDPLLVAAIIKSESSFERHARSGAGAVGLMQLLPDTGRYISGVVNLSWHGSWKLKDPEYNIKLGIAYIKYLKGKFRGNLEHALIAYNWGPANLTQALKHREHIPASTVKYARTIMSTHRRWKQDYTAQLAGIMPVDTTIG